MLILSLAFVAIELQPIVWFFTKQNLQNIYCTHAATWWQFHQHFMSSFCVKILSPRNYKPKLWAHKSGEKNFCTKKLVVKYWWNWHLVAENGSSLILICICNLLQLSHNKLQWRLSCSMQESTLAYFITTANYTCKSIVAYVSRSQL